MRIRFFLLFLLLASWGCSGSAPRSGGTAAPAPGPGETTSLQLRLQIPGGQRQARGEILQVLVEIVDPSVSDASTLSGRRVVASGQASVPPGAGEVLVLIPGVPRGGWQVQAFGRDAESAVVALSHPMPLEAGVENLVLTLQLEPVGSDEPVLGLSITPLAPVLAQGTTLALRAFDTTGREVTSLVAWRSSDPGVASIDATGLATGLTAGSAVITAELDGALATTMLTVSSNAPTSLTLSPLDSTLGLGLSQNYSAVANFPDGSTQDVTASVVWSSDTPGVAMIDAAGLATTAAPGTTTITATLGSLSASTSLTVTSATVQSLSLTPVDPAFLSSGRARQFQVLATFSDGTTSDATELATWASLNPAVAVVSDTPGTRGELRTTGTGTATITATLGGVVGSTDVSISSNPVVTMLAPQGVAVGQGSQTLDVGDFNADGNPDVVTGNVNANTLSVVLGNGDGTFATPQDFATGNFPLDVVVGDFNADGLLDAASVNSASENVSVLLGNGDGTLQAAMSFTTTTGSLPQSLAAGDLDGDGDLDLVTANLAFDQVAVLLNNGNGTFPLPSTVNVGDAPVSVKLGDLNGDGALDLATANFGGSNVSAALGNGNGTFGAAANFGVASGPQNLAMGDFSNDGILDLATANPGTDDVSVLLGVGDGTFGLAANFTTVAGGGPSWVDVGDFNADGRLDLVACNQTPSTNSILLGNGDGTLQAGQEFAAGQLSPFAVVFADFNLDGCLDVANACLEFPGFLTVRLQDPVSP